MIKRQIERVKRRILDQSFKILGKDRRKNREKRQFIDSYISKIEPSTGVSREMVAIIVTGFISELRQIPKDIALEIIKGD